MFSPLLALLGAISALAGIAIFATDRFMKKATEELEEPQSKRGYPLPSDVSDQSGWGRGGRSEGWMSSSDSDIDGD